MKINQWIMVHIFEDKQKHYLEYRLFHAILFLFFDTEAPMFLKKSKVLK